MQNFIKCTHVALDIAWMLKHWHFEANLLCRNYNRMLNKKSVIVTTIIIVINSIAYSSVLWIILLNAASIMFILHFNYHRVLHLCHFFLILSSVRGCMCMCVDLGCWSMKDSITPLHCLHFTCREKKIHQLYQFAFQMKWMRNYNLNVFFQN